MNKDKEFRNVLKHYVKRQSESEIDFIDEQRKFGLKVCDRISHQRSREGKDKLVIETQLSSTNGSSDSSINRTCTMIRPNNSSADGHSNGNYFIKELLISHGKSKSLDSAQVDAIQRTSLTTVVGNTERPYETVYQAIVDHSDTGPRQVLHQNSFVRDACNTGSSCHSLPTRVIHSLSLPPHSDISVAAHRKHSKKPKLSWKSFFSHTKKNKHIDSNTIDKLAKLRVSESAATHVEDRTLNSLSFDQDMPFKSYPIGAPLQRMKKKIPIPYFIRNILSPKNSLSKTAIWSSKDHNNNTFSLPTTDDASGNEGQQGHVTRIVTTLTRNTNNEDFTCSNTRMTTCTASRDAISSASVHEDVHNPRDIDKLSGLHFDLIITDSRTRLDSAQDKCCDCDTRRLDLMVKGINVSIKKGKYQDVMSELKEYDNEMCHFKDCPCKCNGAVRSGRKDSECSSSGSVQSGMGLYRWCQYCSNADDQLHPEISVHLLPLINKLESGDEINFNEDHLAFFLAVNCYKEFEEGMRQAIGFKCSVRNVAHVHYVTRKVVRYIGTTDKGQSDEDNDRISRIMYFAEKFCTDHYKSHIDEHGSLEEFLKHCKQEDID